MPSLILILVVSSGLASLAVPAGETTGHGPDPAPGRVANTDGRMFAAVVERLRSGEPYYEAMGAELRRRGYPTRRGLQLAYSAPPHRWWRWHRGRVWRGVLTGAAGRRVRREAHGCRVASRCAGSRGGRPDCCCVASSSHAAAQDAVFVSEAWAGPRARIVGVRVRAGRSWHRRLDAAIAALFIRELAAPYCVTGTLLACADRPGREQRSYSRLSAAGSVCALYGGAFAGRRHDPRGRRHREVQGHRSPAPCGAPYLDSVGRSYALEAYATREVLAIGGRRCHWLRRSPTCQTAMGRTALILLMIGVGAVLVVIAIPRGNPSG